MMEVRVTDYRGETRHYGISYADLRDEHRELCSMSTSDFMSRLPRAIHLACVIGWLKELPADATVGDAGIVHELVHLICGTYDHEERNSTFAAIRKQFAEVLRLA